MFEQFATDNKICHLFPRLELGPKAMALLQSSLSEYNTTVTVLFRMLATPLGEDHCTSGVQFNWIGFDQTRKYVVFCIY